MNTYVMKNIYNYFSLNGKIAIVTGSGNGIGKATAKMMAGLGAKVMVCDIEEDNIKRTVEEIKDFGGTAIGMYCDITNVNMIKNTVDKTVDEFGTVDILVNNAGTPGRSGEIGVVDQEELERVMNTNVTGIFNFINIVVPIMRAKKYGKIVTVSSGAGVIGTGTFHYAASKAAVIAMSKGLARQLGREGINVNIVAPGVTRTRMADDWEFREVLERFYCVGEPNDIAAAITFLSSDSSRYFSGQVISPNGGEYMF
ncbi:MAG: SDR family oxidoreductase [Clostridia bacterium]|nr:SDR family oxidoreductase [Clostridia bacterium]